MNVSSKLKPGDAVARALFEQAPVAMLMIDRAGTVQYVNSAAEHLFGYSKRNPRREAGRTPCARWVATTTQQHREVFFEAPAARPMGKGRRLTARHKDGHEILVEVGLNPVTVGSDPIVVLASFRDNSAQERAETAELLVRELTHRAKNLFAVISAMAHQIGMLSPDVASFQSEFDDRLHSIATSYELLVREKWQGALIADLVRSQLAFVDRRDLSQITTEGPALRLSASPAEYLGLAIHELATNALKYGALSVPGGSVSLRWATDEACNDFNSSGGSLTDPPWLDRSARASG